MTEPPVVIREFPQPSTGGLGSETSPLLYRNQYIIFEASAHEPFVTVEVLAGEGAPTITGGYAKWAKIPRPQRVALTVFEGYEPRTVTVPVLFDAVRNNGVQENVEDQIQWLEWMAGRGPKHHEGFTVGVGKPVLLVVFTAAGKRGSRTPLVSIPIQNAESGRTQKSAKWFIENIAWDEHPLRSDGGARIRQAATVTLVEFVEDPVGSHQKKEGHTVKHTTKSLNTLKKLVLHYARGTKAQREEAWKVTLKENSHNKAIGTHAEKPLKVGTPIRIANRFLVA